MRVLGARILALTLLIVATGLLGMARAGDPFAELSLIRPKRPTVATAFSAPQLDSQQLRLSDFKGRVVFLNFWATWCVPCREEMPSMERLYQRYGARGLTIVAMSVDSGGPATVAAFVKMLRLTYLIGLDPKMVVAEQYRVRALPSSFLIDRHGNLAGIAVGARDWDSPAARAVVETLL